MEAFPCKLLDSSLKFSPSVFRIDNKKTETISPVCPRSWKHNEFQKNTCSCFQHPSILFLIQHPGFNSVFQVFKNIKVRFGETANQGIDDTNLNDASVGTKAQKLGFAATKNNGNGMVRDGPPPTNDAVLDNLDSDAACQDHQQGRQEC